jgi:hypothetical protein
MPDENFVAQTSQYAVGEDEKIKGVKVKIGKKTWEI